MKIGTSETDKIAADLLRCRQITSEILHFGVSQDQIMQIIYLLALELENREALSDITSVVKSHKVNLASDNEPEPKTKLLEI